VVRRLFVARHAETAESQDSIVQGQSDTRLSDRGRSSAQALGDHLAGTEVVSSMVSSDLERAVETARLVSSRLTTSVSIDLVPELREIACGVFEGDTFAALQEYRKTDPRGPEYAEPPGGETIAELRMRVLKWFHSFLPSASSGTLIVTHRGPITMVLESVRPRSGQNPDRMVILPCHVFTLEVDDSHAVTVVDSWSPSKGSRDDLEKRPPDGHGTNG
jgi:broad specificity phosphatase PhoE